eukprot:1137121-Pelagomonas_calceolata.AAC.2
MLHCHHCIQSLVSKLLQHGSNIAGSSNLIEVIIITQFLALERSVEGQTGQNTFRRSSRRGTSYIHLSISECKDKHPSEYVP